MDTLTLQRGAALFNAREYFDAHEVWEDVWRAAPVEEKKFLQGLIQVAVALHHHSRGNLDGARSLLDRAQRNLLDYPDSFSGVNLAAVRAAITQCQQALNAGAPLLPFRISIA
jgi:predicted metal-dependent hydrolase